MSEVAEAVGMDEGHRNREDAFRELETFLRAGIKAIEKPDSTLGIKRISDGFEFDDQDVECIWSDTAHGGQPGWQVVYYYTELDYITDEARYVGPELVRTFPAGEEHDVAKHGILTVVGNWLESAMAKT